MFLKHSNKLEREEYILWSLPIPSVQDLSFINTGSLPKATEIQIF